MSVSRQANMAPRTRTVIIGAAVFAAASVAATLALWAHLGTTVFYEVIRAGIAACM